MTKLLNFLGDHVVISDVSGMFAERKTIHIFNVTQNVRRDLNKINNSLILEVYSSSAFVHAFNCRVKFYLPILRSFTVAGYPRSPAVLASSRW